MKKDKIDVNSVVNQDIKGKFVEREVKACFSYEMEAILRASQNQGVDKDYPLPTYEDIENLYQDVCEKCGETREYFDATGGDHCSCGGDWESQPQEVFEWWIVTEYLYRKLKEKNEPVLEWGNNCYWGRCTTGQAILLDGVISSICQEMGILEGQRNSWAENK